jgi:hypothetical protein
LPNLEIADCIAGEKKEMERKGITMPRSQKLFEMLEAEELRLLCRNAFRH